MNKMKERWSQKLWYEKLVFIIGMFCSVSVIVLACLQVFSIWQNAAYAYMPLSALLMLVQAFENRKKKSGLVIISLCAAAIVSICWILVVFVL